MSEFSNLMPKRIARVAAVQFVYKMSMTGVLSPSETEIQEFIEAYVERRMNQKLFMKLIDDVRQGGEFDDLLDSVLDDGRTISNSPPVEVCIIKVALAEMVYEKTDIPVIINEYVDIAKAFLDKKAAKFINALLDKASKKVNRKCQVQV